MERTGTDGGSDLAPGAGRARAGRSRRRSGESSNDGPEKGDTATAGGTQSDLEIELSILQSNYEKCLNFGLKARAIPTQTIDGQMPVLVIQMLNVGKCQTCGSWIVGPTCPTCGSRIIGKICPIS